MFGATLRCKVCNQYVPDRCTCNGHSPETVRGYQSHKSAGVLKMWTGEGNKMRPMYISEDTFLVLFKPDGEMYHKCRVETIDEWKVRNEQA